MSVCLFLFLIHFYSFLSVQCVIKKTALEAFCWQIQYEPKTFTWPFLASICLNFSSNEMTIDTQFCSSWSLFKLSLTFAHEATMFCLRYLEKFIQIWKVKLVFGRLECQLSKSEKNFFQKSKEAASDNETKKNIFNWLSQNANMLEYSERLKSELDSLSDNQLLSHFQTVRFSASVWNLNVFCSDFEQIFVFKNGRFTSPNQTFLIGFWTDAKNRAF